MHSAILLHTPSLRPVHTGAAAIALVLFRVHTYVPIYSVLRVMVSLVISCQSLQGVGQALPMDGPNG